VRYAKIAGVRYRFGEFELAPERYELLAAGEAVALEPRVMEVLSFLVEHRDRTVTKTELLETLWEGEFVSESALTRVIRELRKALGDSASDPEFVKTIYGRGFLFIGEVAEVDEGSTVAEPSSVAESTEDERVSFPAQSPPEPQAKAPTKGIDGVFVGRNDELESLLGALDGARSGRGRILMLVGGPGIGKTRTAQRLAVEAKQRGVRALWGRSLEGWRAPPYWPWVSVIRSYLETVEAETLREELGAGAADIAEIVPEVRELLPDLEPAPTLEDPEQARFRFFDSMSRFLRRASAREPLVVVLDNLHWCDKPSLLFLEMLAHEVAHSRLLVVGTYRDMELSRSHPLSDTLGALGNDGLLDRIRLRGFDLEEVAEFVVQATDVDVSAPAACDLIEVVHNHTEGNPFFVSEVVRLLADEGPLASADAIRNWDPARSRIGVPEGVQQVVGRRLNRLSQDCNRVLGHAAVIGRTFEFILLEGLCGDSTPEAIQACLDEAAEAGILFESGDARGTYQFSHALIRETLYDELSTGRRAREHRNVGEGLEALSSGDLDRDLPRLAHHYFEGAAAGCADAAVNYCERAGRRAAELLADEEAVWFFRRALEALELRPSSGDDAAEQTERCRLLLELGKALRRTEEMQEAVSTFLSAASIARKLGLGEALAEAALGVQFALFAEPAVKLLEEALAALPEEDSALKVRVLCDLTLASFVSDQRDRGEELGQLALAMARRLDDPSALYSALRASIPTFDTLNPGERATYRVEDVDRWLATSDEMLALSEELGETVALFDVHGYRVHTFLGRGDVDRLHDEIDAYRHRAARLRQPMYRYLEPIHRAMVATFEGRFEEGEALAIEARRVGERVRFASSDGLFGLQMFTLRRLQGRLGEIAGAVEHFVSTRSGPSVWRPGLALMFTELGALDRATEVYDEIAAGTFELIPRDALWTTALVYLTEVVTAIGDRPGAEALYRWIRPRAMLQAPRSDGGAAASSGGIAYLGAMGRYVGLLAALLERWEESESGFESALQMDESLGAAPWVAMTEASYADMLDRRGGEGDGERATELRTSALKAAEQLGMKALEHRLTERIAKG